MGRAKKAMDIIFMMQKRYQMILRAIMKSKPIESGTPDSRVGLIEWVIVSVGGTISVSFI